ncbi:MAG: metalloregulator ArsR/SmtB family transcription factor [Desulfobacterales bacterium]|jgi:ArsR family transcriptional regulator
MELSTRETARKRASICHVFGSTHRVLIAWVLGEEEMSVSDIANAVDSSMQNVSQHLRLMKDKGILQSRRDGRSIYYRIADNVLTKNCPIFQDREKMRFHINSDSKTKKGAD